MSDVTLTEKQKELLSLNSNFSIKSKVNLEEIIAPIDKSIRNSKLSIGQKELLKHLIAKTILENQNSHCNTNLSKEDRNILKDLNKNPNLIITKADKGGQIVVMNTEQYKNGLTNILNDGHYIKLRKDLTDKHLDEAKWMIKSCKTLDDNLKKKIIPSSAISARMYALPKVHKENIPFRPIVSTIGTATYDLAKYLAKKLNPLKEGNINIIKNSLEFVDKIHNLDLPTESIILVSLDVKSLFSSIPISGALAALKRRLRDYHFLDKEIEEILNLVSLCLNQNSFTVHNNIYKQISGLAMGSPLSPILSEIYMFYFEEELLSNIEILFYTRYVDDTFVIWNHPKDELPNLLQQINSIDSNIQFTYETEDSNKSLPFLDVLISRKDNKFETTIYRKSFAVSLPPHAKSNHPMSQKIASFATYVNRALKICSSNSLLQVELGYLKEIAFNRGYNPKIIDSIYYKLCKPKPCSLRNEKEFKRLATVLPYTDLSKKISKILKPQDFHIIYKPTNKLKFSNLKDKIEDKNQWGIYNIKCECQQEYIGQTIRCLKRRINEHKGYVKTGAVKKSSVAQHCWEKNHKFNFNEARIIARPKYKHDLNFYEAFHINKNKSKLVNNMLLTPNLSYAWKNLINDYFGSKILNI